MSSVYDVANYYLTKESMSPKKLQKLVYYAYGWTLALLNDSVHNLDHRLFSNRIEAWVHGPVVPDLYHEYKTYGWQDIPQIHSFDTSVFSKDEEDILSQVWSAYGHLNANQLEMISHKESPWINARNGAAAYVSSSNAIKDEDMFVFFNEQANS